MLFSSPRTATLIRDLFLSIRIGDVLSTKNKHEDTSIQNDDSIIFNVQNHATIIELHAWELDCNKIIPALGVLNFGHINT